MIERNLRYVTVRQYGAAFLEAFGMLPLTYFGAVGDNQTDNYANLQVAIDESIKRGLNFIFVPNGDYLYRGTLLNTDKITFIGNAKYASIYNADTLEKLKIYQIGAQSPWIKGHEDISETLEHEQMCLAIPLPVNNPTEALLIINADGFESPDVWYITDGIVTIDGIPYIINGERTNTDPYGVENDVYIVNVYIEDNKLVLILQIREADPPATVEFSVDWRVR